MNKKVIYVIMACLTIIFSLNWGISKIEIRMKQINTNNSIRVYEEYVEKLRTYCNRVNNNEDGIEEELLKIYNNSYNNIEKGMSLSVLSYYYLVMGDEEKHIKFGEDSIDYYDKSEEGALLALETFQFLIKNARFLNDIDRGLMYCYESLNRINSLQDRLLENTYIERFKIVVNCTYMYIYVSIGMEDKALEYYKEIKDMNVTSEIYKAEEENILYSKFLYYSLIEDKDNVLKYALEYQGFMEKTNNPHKEGTRVNIARALMLNNRHEEALIHLKAAEDFYNNTDLYYQIAYVVESYGIYYEDKGDYEKAYGAFTESYKILNKKDEYYSEKIKKIEQIININEVGNLNNDIDRYLNDYLTLNNHLNSDSGSDLVKVLKALDNVTKKEYETQILIHNFDKEELKKSSKEKMNLIILLLLAGLLLIMNNLKLKRKIAENVTYQKSLENIANRDYLTQTATRLYGINYINNLIYDNKKFLIALLDIDNFKSINDTYGHVQGDEVLRLLGKILRDKFSDKGMVIRYGGEEFLVVMEEEISNGKLLLEEAKRELAESRFIEDINITFSAGLKRWNGEELEIIIDEVDKLLYKAKSEGKDRIIL